MISVLIFLLCCWLVLAILRELPIILAGLLCLIPFGLIAALILWFNR